MYIYGMYIYGFIFVVYFDHDKFSQNREQYAAFEYIGFKSPL